MTMTFAIDIEKLAFGVYIKGVRNQKNFALEIGRHAIVRRAITSALPGHQPSPKTARRDD